jgi:hypothetical protein
MAFSIHTPAKLETQKLEARLSLAITTERDDPCFVWRQFQSELP